MYGVSDLLKMMLHLADLNAREVKAPYRRGRVTAAMLEEQEWDAFKAKLHRRKLLLSSNGGLFSDDEVEDLETSDLNEDDVDNLLALIVALEAKPSSTMTEIVRVLQRDKVLTLEFPASARMQAQRMLGRLRELNRAWCDERGRWSLI